ncbi:SET domain-containing protein 3 [Kalmusia sp. IMI 367209]|nr:SET domain-containing protein 3 [Kalmusia sp. IMI 367209]
MTDVSSVKAHADHQPASVAHYGPPPPAFTNGSPALDGTIEEEESSTIKCICGFADDDGNTVLCEKCDTWQHIVCYYESAQHVPDVHECADCLPRHVDKKSAVDKQRQRRELNNIGERKGRPRTTTKSHKKRPKDPLGSVQPNGWAIQSNNDLHYNTERKSGSPRDQPPPAKRPKTSHRPSGSVGMISQVPTLTPGSRKRGSSVMLNGHSPVKSPINPEGPIEEFSLEFMNLYRQAEPPPTTSNSYTDLGVANDISLWLNDRDALAEATGGMNPGEVFQRIDQSIEEMENSLAPVLTKQTEENPGIKAHGLHPQWHFVMVETPVAEGGFIGELKGHIGRKQDYYSDPANRWELLRHPEPFVFFPPHLPIYIDTRHEGTILRYTRRSCNPNTAIKILMQGSEGGHHFCFLATRDIEPGEELTIGWDIDYSIRQQLEKAVTNGDIKKEGFKKIQPWVACVLANFGGCACDNSTGHECLLDRARRPATTYAEPVQPLKSMKSRKTKKIQVSPLSTGHATNSRAGSESLHRDPHDDENMDSRSTSGSHKSSSRDITPATHFSMDDGNGKMSERERRKLQQQERLFEQMDYDEQHKGKRGKRNSAGSTLNTPSLSSSVRRHSRRSLFVANLDMQKQLGHTEPSPSARHPREHSNGVARKTSGGSVRTNGRLPPKPKPAYVDSSTQTDSKLNVDAPTSTFRPMRPPMSFKRKLLQQAQEDKLQRERIRSASVKLEMNSPALKDVSSSKPSPTALSASLEEPIPMDISTETATEVKPKDQRPDEDSTPVPSIDVEMKDAEVITAQKPSTPKVEDMPDAPSAELSPGTSHPPIQPPAPPWDSPAAPENGDAALSAPQQKPTDMRLEVPVKPELVIPPSTASSVVTSGSAASALTGSAIAQSPVGAAAALSPFSPAVASAVTPGPARKKLSLSDYTSRRKLAQQTSNATGTPPLNPTQSTSSPTLSNASLPTNTSPPAKHVEPILPPVTEETQPAPATMTTTATASTSTST